ncbi:YybH family protein [Acinetobacter sp. WZC-1]|uniref:YybH family protein n=1 Tax=Acinetobacter sp. WZC-1 TaxID=3459034 RepID=UPI00403D575C
MRVEIEGDRNIAAEVLQQIQRWDRAIAGKHIDDLMHQCADDIRMFDVSSQLSGAVQYKTAWEKFSPYFNDNMQIIRRDAKLYAEEGLAILHCFSRVEDGDGQGELQMPWCRTTLCLHRKEGQWQVIHQHISIPVDMLTGKAIPLKDQSKLRLVV